MKKYIAIATVVLAVAGALGFSIYQQACVEKTPIGLYPSTPASPMPGMPE